jgi:hypothetical protein
MNGADGTGPTIRDVLNQGESDESLRSELKRDEVAGAVDGRLDPVSPGLRGLARDEVITVVLRTIDMPLVDVLVAGWRKWEELVAAAERSLRDPLATECLELHDHHMSSTHRPRIDVTLDGEPIAHVELTLELDALLHAVTAVVENGHLTELRTGHADVTARLSIEGIQVAEKGRSIELPIELGLGEGIALRDTADVVVLPPSPADSPAGPG